jgi:membrane-bound lytic murein transglycosylase D
MNYVPKLIALSRIVADPERYGIELPAITNEPAFARVPVEGRLSLSRLADMAGISYRRLKALNPALLRGATLSHRSPDLLVPRAQKKVLEKLLAKRQAQFASSDRYRVRQGDSLSLIAARHSVSVGALKRYNSLHGNLIRTGQVLRIPGGTDSADRNSLVYRVRLGDSLSGIAARHDVSPADILRWNQLEAGQYLQPGQRLTLYAQ